MLSVREEEFESEAEKQPETPCDPSLYETLRGWTTRVWGIEWGWKGYRSRYPNTVVATSPNSKSRY